MGSHGGISNKRGASLQLVWAAFLALCLLLSRCSPCEGRKLLVEEQGKMMYFEGGLVLRVLPRGGGDGGDSGEESSAVPRGFSVSGRAERLMRSVPSPGVGH